MNTEDRELIRSTLQQVEVLSNKVERKLGSMVEQVWQIQATIKEIEQLLKPIHLLIDREGGGIRPGG